MLNLSFDYPRVSDQNYLLLLDARKLHEYNESHIFTAKKASKNDNDEFTVTHDAELECKINIVVYDGTTESLDELDTPAMQCGKLLADKGSRNQVQILCGGYERFSALYPFLRTQKILWLPQELDDIKTYPIEILPATLYLGNSRQGTAEYITKDLKLQGKICLQEGVEPVNDEHRMNIPIADNKDADLTPFLNNVCAFIDLHREKKLPVLVYSDLGYSRAAAVCIAYLMHINPTKPTVQESYEQIRRCNEHACPTTALLTQLEAWQ